MVKDGITFWDVITFSTPLGVALLVVVICFGVIKLIEWLDKK